MLRRAVHTAADACLSGVDAMPSLHGDIMRQIKGEKIVKKKISFALVCAIIMTLALGGVALAAGLANLSQFSKTIEEDQPWNAERLVKVDSLMVGLNETVSLKTPKIEKKGDTLRDEIVCAMSERKFDLTIENAYCNGNKLYFTYVLAHDEDKVYTGEGKPTGFDKWDLEYLDAKWGDYPCYDNYDYVDREDAWFAEHPTDSWFAALDCYVGDGADTTDGKSMRIWDGWTEKIDENSTRGFYEVEIPEGYPAGDSVDIVLNVLYKASLTYVDAEGIHHANISPVEDGVVGVLKVPLTIPVTGSVTPASGEMKNDEYSAKAELLVSEFDIAGTVTVTAAEGWDTSEKLEGSFVQEYRLIADGEEYRFVDGSLGPIGEDGTYEVGVRFNLPKSMKTLALRPVRHGMGVIEDGSEDIPITISK